jgi:hypothetical protein
MNSGPARVAQRIFAILLLCVLTACGGGGGDDSDSPPPSSNPPPPQNPVPPPPPPPSGPITLGAHPRLWINAERLNNLRAHVAADSSQWRYVKMRADAQLARGTAFTGDSDEYALGDLGLACLLTDDARYAQRAASVLTQYAVPTNTLQRDSAFDYRYLSLAAMAYDWCYDKLSDTVRKQVATWMMDRADWVWPETNAVRREGWGVASAPNNYFWGFMMTGPAAIAAYGDDTKSGTASGANRPEYHINLVRAKWHTLVEPFITGWAKGGVFAEGTNYESTRPMAMFADAFYSSMNDATYQSRPFFKQLYQWQLQQVTPDGQHYVYLGEQARDSEGSIIYYERTHHLMLAAFPNIATATEKAISYHMASQWTINQNSLLGLTALDMIYWDLAVTPSADRSSLPRAFIDPSTGLVVYRTSQTDPDATLVMFESGLLLESHQLFNANGLMMWKGDFWTLGHGQMCDHEYDLSQSSTIFTNAGQQTWQEATNEGGHLLAADAQSGYLYAAGQAKEAYGRQDSRPLTDFVRKIAYIVDLDAVVVMDRVAKSAAATELTWRWWACQQTGTPTATGADFSFTNLNGDVRLYGQNVLGGTAAQRATDTHAYVIETTSNTGSTGAQFAVTAMRHGSAPGASATETADRISTLLGGNFLVSFGKAETAAATVTLNTNASRFLVADLTPNAGYRASDGTNTADVQTSTSGVAFFNLNGSGTRQVTLTRQ